jgi:hypothetical protein
MSLTLLPKKALLVGINYTSIPQIKLNGCISDINNISNTLQDAFDYASSDIIMLRDDIANPATSPTRANILNYLNRIVSQSANLSEIWFHYSGHGSQVKDLNGDEIDKLDEIIVPIDYSKNGFITDDEIFNIIKNSKCRTILLFDSCNSGSICDLQYAFEYDKGKVVASVNKSKSITTNPNIICMSGCKDNQTSADVYVQSEARSVGAFTTSFLLALRKNRMNVDLFKLHNDICNILISSRLTQLPVLSSSGSSPTYSFTRANIANPYTYTVPPSQLKIVQNNTGKEINNVFINNMEMPLFSKNTRKPSRFINMFSI